MAISAKELGELVIKITADTQDVEQAMSKIRAAVARTSAGGKGDLYELEKAASRVGVGFTSLGRLSTRIGSTITTKITAPLIGAGTAAAKTAIDFLELKEKTKISFETLLGSAEKAKTLMGELYEFAKTTPFSQETFYEAAQQLLAMGFSAQETKDDLEAFTNASIATGRGQEGINTLTKAFGKMNASGKVSLEALNMITDMGIPAIDMLSNAYDVNKESMFEMIHNGEILADEALPKLLDAMMNGTEGINGTTAAYGELAAKMKEGTITGALDSLHSAWRNFSLAVFDADTEEKQEEKVKKIVALLTEVKRVLNGLAPVFGSITSDVDDLLDLVTNKLKEVADFLETAPKEDLQAIGDILINIAKAGPMFLILGGALKIVGSAFRGVSGYAKIVDEMNKLKELGGITGIVKNFGKTIGSLPGKLKGCALAASNFIRGLAGLSPATLEAGAGIGAIGSALAPLIIIILAVIAVVVFLKNHWQEITKVFENFAKHINLEEKFKKIEEAFSNLAQAMGGEGGSLFESLGQIFDTIGGIIMGVLSPAFALLAGAFDGVISALPGVIQAFQGVLEMIGGFADMIVGLFTGDKEKMEQGLETFKTGFVNAVKGLGEAIGGAFGGIIEGIGSFIISIVEAFTGADLSEAENIAKDIGDGIKKGWDDFWANPGEFAQQVWDAIVNGIKSIFGIASPAKNMEPYGQNIGEGIKQGWDDFIQGASEWAQGLWDGIVSGVEGLLGGAAELGGNIVEGIKGGVEGAAGWLQETGTNVANAVGDGIEGAKNFLQDAGSAVGGAVNAGVEGAKNLASQAGSALGNAVHTGVQGAKSLVSGAGKALGGAAKTGVAGAKSLVSAAGKLLGVAVKGGVQGNKSDVMMAGKTLGIAAKGGVDGTKNQMTAVAKAMVNLLKSGINAGKSVMASAAKGLGLSVKSPIVSAFQDARTWGSHLASNLASGIRGGIGAIKSAASAAAQAAKSVLGHTVPEDGPLTDELTWMPHMIDNLSSTLTKASPKLLEAATGVAAEMQDTMDMGAMSFGGDITRNLQVNAQSNLAGAMNQMLGLMQVMAGKPDPNYQIVLETGVVAGAMTNQIDRNLGTLNHRRSKGL